MKILIVTDYHNKTGAGKQNYHLFLSLKAIGHDVQIFNLVSPQGFRSVPNYGINVESKSFICGIFRFFRAELASHLASNAYDFVLLGHHGLSYLKGVIERSGNHPVLSLADLFTLDFRYTPWYDMRYWVYNIFMLKGFDTFENVVFNSDFTKISYLEKVGRLPKRYAVIHIGANAATGNSAKDWAKEFGNRKVVLQVGSSDIRKNVTTFMRIAERYSDRKEEISFVRVGFTSRRFAESAPDNVTLLSGLSENDLLALYRYAKAFVFTSFAEGYGMPVVEARLASLPVISSKVSDMATIFENDDGLVLVEDPLSVDEYVSGLDRALNGDMPRELAEDIRKNLSIEKEAEDYASFFAGLR